MIKKFIKIAFGFLTVILIIEILFLLFPSTQYSFLFKKNGKNNKQLTSLINEKFSNESSNYLLSTLAIINRNTITSLTITTEADGVIERMNLNGGVLPDNIPYNIRFDIKNLRDPLPTTFYYNSNDANKIRVVKYFDGKEEEIPITNIKIGDKIKIREIFDLKQNQIKEIKIINY